MGEHDGHRMRMLQRLEEGVLYDHELLEVLLFNALPRRNTNDLAHRLLAEFGTVRNVLDATATQLQRVQGIGPSVASYLSVVGKIASRVYLAENEMSYPSVYEVDEFLSFAKQKYVKVQQEVLDFYFMESDGRLCGCKRFSQESLFRVKIKPEDVSQLFSEMQPSGIVVVHNHPLGKAEPSKKDEEMTTQVQLLCSVQNIIFCDHVIVAKDGAYSYYRSGKLKGISKTYSVPNLLSKTEYGEEGEYE